MRLYGRTNKSSINYPNGVRLRYVKLKKDALNSEEKGKLDKLRNRQMNFLKSIKSSTPYEVLQLDYSPEVGKAPTLHQMIMSLKSSTKLNTPIFHCVDMDWQEDGFVFQYSPQLAEEAETAMNTLLPLLRHHFPDGDVGSNFTCAAEERCQNMQWDDNKKMIVDKVFLESGDMGDEETLVGFEFDAEIVQEMATRPSQTLDFVPGDNDAVSTFKSIRSRYMSPLKKSNVTSISNITESTSSATSNVTMPIASASTSAQSTELATLTEQVQLQQQKFQDLQVLLQQLLKTTTNYLGYLLLIFWIT